MQDEPIIIVDDAGNEHEFPAGFDPKRAGEIVRKQTAATAPAPAKASTLPQGVMSNEDWAKLTAGEKMQNLLKWAGKVVGGTFMGPAGAEAVDHPVATLAGAALPLGLGAAGRSALPLVAPAARATATAIENPLVSTGIGAVTGGYHGGVQGALTGAAAGAVTGLAGGRRTARALRNVANRVDPPPPRATPNKIDVAGGMSRAAQPTAPVAAAPAPPVASPPVAPAPQAAPAAAQSAATRAAAPTHPAPAYQGWSPAKIKNEVGLAARRANADFSEAERLAADDLVAQGKSPVDAVLAVKRQRTPDATAEPPKAAQTPAAEKLKLNSAEAALYARLRSTGKTHAEAATAIETQRKLAAMLGTPSVAEMNANMAKLKATKYKQ